MKKKLLFFTLPFAFAVTSSKISAQVVANAGVDVAICNGQSTNLNGTASGGTPGYTYVWTPSTGLSNPNIANPVATPGTTTSYTLTVTDAATVQGTDIMVVTVNPIPNMTSASTATVCSGSAVNIGLTGTPTSTFSWIAADNPNTIGESTTMQSTSTLNNFLTNNTGSPQIVSYTVTPTAISTGCVGVAQTVNVTVNPTPAPTPVNSGPLCAGQTLSLTVNSIGGATYNWTGPNAFNSVVQNPTISNATAVNAGTYTITATVSGCTGSATTNVIVNSNPVVTVNSATICAGASANLNASGATTYSWAPPTGLSSTTGFSVTANPTSTTIYTVTGTSSAGCVATVASTVTVNSLPTVAVNSAAICMGGSANLNASGATTYNWSPSTGLSATTGANVTASPTSTTVYTVTGTSATGCVATVASTVTVNPLPVVNTSNNSPVCEGQTLNITSTNNATSPSYSWAGPNGFVDFSQNPNVASVLSAAGTYTLTLTDVATGCVSTSTTNATINPLPTVTATSNGPVCVNDPLNLTCSATATTPSFNWNGPSSYFSSVQNPVIGSAGFGNAGTYTVSVTDGSTGCSGTATVSVVVNNIPSASASSNAPVCDGSMLSLSASFVAGAAYNWAGPNTFSSSLQNPTISSASSAEAGTYTLSVTDGSTGCMATATVIVNVNPALNVTASGSNVTCNGAANGTTMVTVSGGTPAFTYTWTPVGGNAPTASGLAAGSYTVTVTDANGCIGSSSYTIVQPTLFTVNAGIDQTVCDGTPVSLTAGFNGGAFPYSNNWSTGATTPTINVSPASATTYVVNATDANGCTAMDTVMVFVNPNPVISVNSDSICMGTTATLTATGATTYLWSTSATTSTILVNPSVNTVYYVSGTDANGCSATDSAMVTVTASTDIIGHVAYSGGDLTSGNIFLIAQGAVSAQYDTIAIVSPDGTGNYVFTAAVAGNYYIRAEAGVSSIINTYFGDAYLWDSASVVNHGCLQNDAANITMIEIPAISGPGTISGTVYEGLGFGQKIIPGNPVPYANVIPGVPVKVGKNPSGTIVASGSTDANGVYTFSNLPIDDYTIYVDIPGYPMDSSYTVSITSSSPTATDLNYVVDSNSVFVDLTLSSHTIQTATTVSYISAFPNPAQDKATVAFDVTENSSVNFELYNLQGEKVATILNRNFEKGNYKQVINFDQYGITNGTYLMKANINNKLHIVRLVVMR